MTRSAQGGYLLIAAFVSALLSGCGGGGGGGAASAIDLALSGTAASGAPMASATITVTPASGAAKTVTAGADGSYSVVITGMMPPLVITAVGTVGDAEVRLFSVHPATETATVNITPVTNAIAATIASTGNPLDLLTAGEKINITKLRIDASEAGFRAALGDVLTAVGATGSLINTAFRADGSSALDKLLDNVKIEVLPNGSIQLSSVKGATGGTLTDDTGTNPVTPADSKAALIAKGVLPSAGDKANVPAPTAGELIGAGDLEGLRKYVETCFTVPSAQRGSFTGPINAACRDIAIATYKHNGRTGSIEFNSTLASASADNAKIPVVEIIRQLTATRVLIKATMQKTDGSLQTFITVAEKTGVASTGGWQLVGNQRNFDMFVNGFANKRNQLANGAVSRYETGLSVFVRNDPANFAQDATVTAVQVFGPGLPGWVSPTSPGTGISMTAVSGCDFWSVTPAGCSSLLRMKVSKVSDGSEFTFATLPAGLQANATNPLKTDAEIEAIKPDSPYMFQLTVGGVVTTFWEHLRSRPLQAAEVSKITFLEASDGAKNTVNTYNGGAKPMFTWTKPQNAAPAYKASFFHGNFSDFQEIRFQDLAAAISCSSNSDCVGGGNFTTPISTTNTGGATVVIFQLIARDRFDTQIFSQFAR